MIPIRHRASRDKLLRQVELNTISSSFGSLSGKLSAMHAELLPRWVAPPVTGETASLQDMHASLAAGLLRPAHLCTARRPFSDPSRSPPVDFSGRLPPNPCEAEIAAALSEARLGARAVSGTGRASSQLQL